MPHSMSLLFLYMTMLVNSCPFEAGPVRTGQPCSVAGVVVKSLSVMIDLLPIAIGIPVKLVKDAMENGREKNGAADEKHQSGIKCKQGREELARARA